MSFKTHMTFLLSLEHKGVIYQENGDHSCQAKLPRLSVKIIFNFSLFLTQIYIPSKENIAYGMYFIVGLVA